MARFDTTAFFRGIALRIFFVAIPTLAAMAQGADSCTSPTLVAGLGPHAFNNASATNGAQSSVCSVTCGRDVWFRWTAPTTATYSLSLCGQASFDTVIAIYAGSSCPGGAPIACNDDSCGTQSSATFATTAGSSYVFQIGSYGTGAGGSGTFSLSVIVPCGTAIGPDVIVGDLTGPTNYSAAGALDAIAIGTTSCNLGDTWLNWFANVNQHPVIGGNLYRYKVVAGAGRFEQIGMSWLKHGFLALSQNLCCPSCASTDGTHLGVGCSDPYTSSRNGTQSGLGPRWQVDANTGAFTYPPANPSYSGTVARRLQFQLSDVETTAGVRFFGEAQYVTPDDALAGNQDNNASWREMSVTGNSSNWNFALSGSTVRAQPAVQAWAQCESGVTLTNVDLPSEGRLVLGHKVTALGGGQYRYEYALYNMNSDDAVRSFRLPIPAGVSVTNIGFHDLPYRNGDGPGNVDFDGTDWSSSLSGGTLTWSTQTFAQNASANALRWGTTYNFRFDVNVAPASGTITLGRFKSGGSATTTAAVPASAGPDSDGDGVTDAADNCPSVPNPSQANADGDAFGDACDTCTDTDGDGFGDPGFPASTCPIDLCPNDPLKSAPGACGCGVPETDSDGDGTPNCIDGCPSDPAKTAPGACGCGTPDTDSDGDGTPNCNDGCPGDPLKIAPGICGCGTPDTDSDGDGTPNCNDGCPNDPSKTAPGTCGCGVAETDSDGDGTPNCNDGCPNDPLKLAPGVCGCGTPDTDSDGDGTLDCNDGCPNDPSKTAPGTCGCGVADTDSDGDGTADCIDGCPADSNKTSPGLCGCGVPDADTDGDGVANCNDNCAAIVNPGQADQDSDGVGDVCDNCANVPNPMQGDCNGDQIGDACAIASGDPDCNANGIPDACDLASGTSLDQNFTGIPDECELPAVAYCLGDGSGTPCPCANENTPGSQTGCLNSLGLGGALVASGVPAITADTLVLSGSQMPSSSALYFQGTTKLNSGMGIAFGDGLRCAGGSIVRLGTKNNVGGGSQYPVSPEPSVSVRGLVAAPGLRTYQIWYRNAAAFCTASTFNLTNAVVVIWSP